MKLPQIIKNLPKKTYPIGGERLKNLITKYIKLGYTLRVKENLNSTHLVFSHS